MCKYVMKENIKTVKVYESDRNWIERMKRRHNIFSLTEVIRKIRNVIQKHKMEEELK